MPTIPLNDY